MFETDWDIVMGAASTSTLTNFDKYTHVDSTYSWGLGNGEDKRILFTVDFEQSFETRKPSEQADVLWTRIESEPIKKPYQKASVTVFNSVRQNTLNFSSDNTALNDAGNYKYRPYAVFYTGPENVDYATTKDKAENDVLIRHSQPVVINFNENTNAILYFPESPVIINGNGKKFTGFIVAKCFLQSVTEEDMKGSSSITLYDGFSTPKNFPCNFIAGTDGAGQTVYFRENDSNPVDKSFIENNNRNNTLVLKETGDIYVYETINAPNYLLLDYSKEDSKTYEVKDATGNHDENATFAKYVNSTYKEKFKTYSGLDDSQISAVTFPDEDYNFTGATYYVKTSDLSETKTKTNDNFVKVLVNGAEKYVDKTKLPYVKVRTDNFYFYVCVYDLKTAWNGSTVNNDTSYSGVRMIDGSYTDEQIQANYGNVKDKGIKTNDNEFKNVDNRATVSDADIFINPNDTWCDSWGISGNKNNGLMKTYKDNWKKTKMEFAEKNGVSFFMMKDDIKRLSPQPQIVAKYHKITLEDGTVKYIQDDNSDNKYYTKVQNNDKNPNNYIIVDQKGNILTKPLTDPEIFSVTDKASNDALSISGDYWSNYTDAPQNPYLPDDEGRILDGQYRGTDEYNKNKDYLIPAFERVYRKSAFNLSEESCYSYFALEDLERINYRYLNVDEVNKKIGDNNPNTDAEWKVNDMFFTTRRAEWID